MDGADPALRRSRSLLRGRLRASLGEPDQRDRLRRRRDHPGQQADRPEEPPHRPALARGRHPRRRWRARRRRGAGGGPGGFPILREYIEFNNPTGAFAPGQLRDPAQSLPPELRVSFLLSEINTAKPLPTSITGVTSTGGGPPHGHHLGDHLLHWLHRIEEELEETTGRLLEWAGCWIENLGRWVEHKPPHTCHVHGTTGPRPPVYTALPFTNATIPGVLLPAFGVVAMLLTVENRGSLPPGSRYTFHIQQRIGGRVVGGSCPYNPDCRRPGAGRDPRVGRGGSRLGCPRSPSAGRAARTVPGQAMRGPRPRLAAPAGRGDAGAGPLADRRAGPLVS